MGGDTVDLEDLHLLHSTSMAYLVSTTDGREVWVPKSLVENIVLGDTVHDEKRNRKVQEIHVMEVREWFAEKEDLF